MEDMAGRRSTHPKKYTVFETQEVTKKNKPIICFGKAYGPYNNNLFGEVSIRRLENAWY